MRYAILADVHANLEALEVVLEDIRPRDPESIVCLGDFVGYGPDPNACVEALRPRLAWGLAGNHDRAALGEADIGSFNALAQAAILWTRDHLNPPVRTYLEALPDHMDRDELYAVHGSVRDPVDEYIFDPEGAAASFRALSFHLCLVGHTHVPAIFVAEGEQVTSMPFLPDHPIHLDEDRRYIVSVGSVGQPRDNDPRAAYVWFDSEAQEVSLIRVAYPFERTQKKVVEAGLPALLAERLAVGR